MKELFQFLENSDGVYPQSYYEWINLYGKGAVKRLVRSGILKYGHKFDYARGIYVDKDFYEVKYFNKKYFGIPLNRNLPKKEFSEEDVLILTFEERAFAERLSQTFEAKISAFKASKNSSNYLIANFFEGNVNYLVFLCFDFRDFLESFEVLKNKKDDVVTIPIIYSWGNIDVPEAVTDLLLTTSADKICPIERTITISGIEISCDKPPQKLVGAKEIKRAYETFSVWPHEFPENPKWSDVTFIFDSDKENVNIGFNCKPKRKHFTEFTFFANNNRTKSVLWNFFVRVAEGKARSIDNSDKTYQNRLNKALKKYFKIDKNALYAGRNEHIIKCRFKEFHIETWIEESNRQRSQIFGSGYDGPVDNEMGEVNPNNDDNFFKEY